MSEQKLTRKWCHEIARERATLLLDRFKGLRCGPLLWGWEVLFSARFSGRGRAGHLGPLTPLLWPLWPVCLIWSSLKQKLFWVPVSHLIPAPRDLCH